MSVPAELNAFVTDERLRLVPYKGDHMTPTLRLGDWMLVVPIDHYKGEGLYVIDDGGEPVVYRFQSSLDGGLRCIRDSRVYDTIDTVSREWFQEHVAGKVVALLKCLERHYLPDAA